MIEIKILFYETKIQRRKCKNLSFHDIILKTDISITAIDIAMKFCMIVLDIHSKGMVSQILYLSPSL